MKKTHNRFDPDGMDERTRSFLGIPDDVRTSDFLVNNGFTGQTPEGRIKLERLSLVLIEPAIIYETQHLFIELTTIIDNYEIAFKTRPLEDIDAVQMEKAQLIWDKIMLIHRALPAINAQRGYKKVQSERASKPRKLTETQRARIVRQYSDGKRNGEGYGLVKALAASYEVSTTTIHAIVKKSQNNRNKIK